MMIMMIDDRIDPTMLRLREDHPTDPTDGNPPLRSPVTAWYLDDPPSSPSKHGNMIRMTKHYEEA